MNRPSELAQPDLWTLRDDRDILHPQRSSAFGHDDRVRDILYVSDQAHFPNIDLLQTRLDEAPARVSIVVCELLLHLSEAESIRDQLIWINADLIFACRTAET